jgi:hypothetical protein
MDDLLLAFAYNVKTTHFQPSSNKVLQPKQTVGCSVSYYQRMLGEQLLQLLNIRENSICQDNSFEWHHGKRTSAFLHISSDSLEECEYRTHSECHAVTISDSPFF